MRPPRQRPCVKPSCGRWCGGSSSPSKRESERVQVRIEWGGGTQTTGEIVRPVGRLEQLSYYPQLCARARELAQEGLTTAAIAQRLNAEGYRPPKRREQFGPQGVQELLERQGVSSKCAHPVPHPGREADEWGLRELAQVVGMPHVTLYNWVCRGWVRARREEHPRRHWIVWADEAEIARLRQQHQRSIGDETHDRWCREVAQTVDPVVPSE